MIGVIVNAAAIVLGSMFGLIFKKGIPERLSSALMTSIGLCVICIGITGILKGENTLILIVAMVFGTAIGTWIDIDKWLNRLGSSIEARFTSGNGTNISIAQGFVAGSLLMCVGAMGIVGSLNAGLSGDISTLLTKSVLDLISSALLVISLGVGVMLSAVMLILYEGSIVLLAQLLQPILSESTICEMTCAGSVMILALGLNLIGVTKIKVANLLPAILLTPFIVVLLNNIGLG